MGYTKPPMYHTVAVPVMRVNIVCVKKYGKDVHF